MRVKIPFLPRFKEPMLQGIKTMTTRTRRYGEIGDTFMAWGREFRIDWVDTVKLRDVVEKYYVEEGCKSPDDAFQVWASLHPRRPLNLDAQFVGHKFSLLGGEKKP